MLAGVTETAAGNVESANFCGNCDEGEDQDQRNQNRQRAPIEKSKNKPERAEDFQPRKIKRQRDTDRPRQKFVIVDATREFHRICERQLPKIDKSVSELEMSEISKQVI